MRLFVIPEIFFAEKGKLYCRIWFYWLGTFVDDIFEPDFIEKQEKELKKMMSEDEIKEMREAYQIGVQLLRQDFKIKKRTKVTKEHIKIAVQVIEYLNENSGTTFSIKGKANIKLICDRILEGRELVDFKVIIDKMTKIWKGTDMQQFLRPITLFNKTKFENYLNIIVNERNSNFSKFADSVRKAKIFTAVRRN
jgi:uncharacterized phage protein (TIGR02220 family)